MVVNPFSDGGSGLCAQKHQGHEREVDAADCQGQFNVRVRRLQHVSNGSRQTGGHHHHDGKCDDSGVGRNPGNQSQRHQHAVAAMTAIRMGKHVYVQKPLAHDVWEARQLAEAARAQGVVTQMGNQGSANSRFREAVEVVWSGAIGPVREVHVWSDRPFWPQGVDRPTTSQPVIQTLDWDLWLGTAPERPYNRAYHPVKWRGWYDFGTGVLGDMGCHTANLPFMALKLGAPASVEAEWSDDITDETYPTWNIVRYAFPARGDLPPVKLTWYDGGTRMAERTKEAIRSLLPGREVTPPALAESNFLSVRQLADGLAAMRENTSRR